VSGIYAVIARHGQIGYERTFGWMDVARREPMRRDAIFHIYSMTKPVVAVASSAWSRTAGWDRRPRVEVHPGVRG
jgi:hypothetical protein